MKKYAILLACLSWAWGTSVQGQTAGGGAGGTGAAGSGAVGGTAVTPGGGTGIGGTPGAPTGTGLNTRRPGGVQTPVTPPAGSGAIGGVPGTAGAPGTGVGGVTTPPGPTTGAIGGVGPGVGGTGGNLPATAVSPLDQGRIPVTGVQPRTGVNTGPLGTGTAPGNAALQRGVTTQPGVGIGETGTGSAADVALSRRIRGQLLNSLGAGASGAGAIAGAAGATLSPHSLANVQINANNGAVTLQGTVPTEAERRLIETRLRQTTGVRAVVNNLQVAAPGAAQGTVGAVGTGTGVGTGGIDTPVGGTVPR